jgi:hypothetical protein
MKSVEKQVQKAILAYLDEQRIFAWRQNVMPFTKGGHFYRSSSINGLPDILGVTPTGRFLAIEVKDIKGKQSLSQEVFQKHVEEHGGLYILARSVEDVQIVLNQSDGTL